MAKRMLIDAAHPEETRVVVLNGNRLEEFDFETSTKKQIKGNIYLAKVTRVEPSLQAAFVEYGGNRHGFLAFSEIHPDYYRIPIADRRAAERREAQERAREEEAEQRGEATPDSAAPPPEVAAEDGESFPAEAEDQRALPAEAARDDAFYERFADAADEENRAAFEPGIEHEREHGATPEHEAFGSGEGDDRGGLAPHETAHAGSYEPVEAQHPDEHRQAPESHGPSAPEATGEDHGLAGSDTIETVGGDDTEEAPRQRARSFRHYKIQEVIKRRQIMLVQVTKEERGNKGAALTTFMSLAGRYCVLMPNTPRGGGVSRKITNATDRRRLKDLMSDLDVPEGMGVIVRTAGSERSKAEIKRDFEYLLRLWDEIRELTLKSTAPALIYEEGNLIKRSIRDLYTRDIEEVIIDGEEGYRTAKAFMKMLMPSHAKRVKLYRDPTVPLFHRFQVETQIDAIHSPVVQLRSGGYIVINPTEALVAIDVNSGRSTKERNIEETALKTNLEAAEEIARQLRLRDLAGLIVIDFIDMEEHRNQAAVERKLKEAMRHDRARIQLGRISPFGLLELSRQRLRPSLLEASTQPCPHCNGTGHIRSTESTALHVLRAIEEEGMRRRSAEISVAVPTSVALYILNHKRDALVQAEARYGFRVAIGSDDALIPPAFRLERLRALTPTELAALPAPVMPVLETEEDEDELVEEEEGEETAAAAVEARSETRPEGGEDGQGRRRRRRRRRGRRGEEEREEHDAIAAPAPAPLPDLGLAPEPAGDAAATAGGVEPEMAGEPASAPAQAEPGGEHGARKRRRRGRRGGRRRRHGEPGEDMSAPDERHPVAAPAPIAETVEYLPPEPMRDDAAVEMVEAYGATPAPRTVEDGADEVPVADRSDQPAMLAPEPAPVSPSADEPHEPARQAASVNVPTHEVTGTPSNPKRGWWRRVIDR